MAIQAKDRIKETSTTTGTGTVTLLGAVAQFQTFTSRFTTSDPVYYAIVGQTGTEWEVGVGQLATTSTLTRTTVLASSNADALVNFSAGTKDVFCTMPADKIVDTDSAQLIPGAKDFGELHNFTLTSSPIAVAYTLNGWLQFGLQNKSNGASASADVVITADTGTDTTKYVDLGINGSGYSVGTWTISGALDAYLYANQGHLTVGTDTAGKELRLHTGGTLAANIRMTVKDDRIQNTVPYEQQGQIHALVFPVAVQ